MSTSPGSGEDENFMVIPIDQTFSDGDQNTWPTGPGFGMPDDHTYREKLASLWLQKTGAAEAGMKYVLDTLPEGYALIDRPRGTNPDIRDRFLYGHPYGSYFYSTIQFFPHFYYLMTGGAGPCECILCGKMAKRDQRGGKPRGRPTGRPMGRPMGTPTPKSVESPKPVGRPPGRAPGRPVGSRRSVGRPPGRPSGTPSRRPPGRPPGRPMNSGAPGIVDKEGTPDVFKMAITELKKRGNWSTAIRENSSMDWRAERPRLDEYFEKLDMQPAYLPRAGEVVLWTTGFEGELAWNPATKSIQIYSPTDDRYHGTPEWRAGVVGQVPEEEVMLQDLVETAPKTSDINYSGFRVETFPDPLSMDKSYSLHYRYVPLKCIKPFNAYEIFLQAIPRPQLHPSVEYAMTIMSSFSLLDKYHFQGTWPNASISCRGIFIGAELLAIGDAVRLRTPTVDIMVIDKITLHLANCTEDPTSPQLAEQYKVRISGKVYAKHADKTRPDIHPHPLTPDQVADVFQTLGMTDHGSWYRVHGGKTITVSQDMVIGRCYEPDALQLLFGTLDCTLDVAGVLKARAYSRQVDNRIAEGKTWFWGDFRTQTLAIDSLNGEDVGHYSETRDVKMWRANLKIIDGDANPVDMRMAKIPGDPGRPSKPKSSFAEVGKLSKLVSTGLGGTDVSNTVSEAEEGSGQGTYGEDERESEGGEETDEDDQEEFVARLDQLRGGTEESEGGDWVPESKRPKH